MNTQRQVFLVVVLMFVTVAGCAAYTAIDLPIRAQRQADFFQNESIERGALLYANNCRTCHGIRGEGGVGLTINKPAFRDQEPLALSQNEDLIRRTLECGRAGTLMPAWLDSNGGSLTANQIGHLVRLLTAPLEDEVYDANGNPTNHGWLAAVEFAHNLNHESNASVTGDTLGLIADAHGVGGREVAALNGFASMDDVIPKGRTVRLPDGRAAKAEANDTPRKLAARLSAGAVIIAELNGIPHAFDGDGAFYLPYDGDDDALALNPDAEPRATGLLPGQTLRLPADATLLVRAGDTLDAIAERHGVTADAIRARNPDLLATVGDIAGDREIGGARRLLLPPGALYVASAGERIADVAETHLLPVLAEDGGGAVVGLTDLPVAVLAGDNALAEDALLAEGQALALRPDVRYVVQFGDSLASIAAAHGVSVDALLDANGLAASAVADAPLSTEVWIAMPPVERYVVRAATLAEVASGFGNVTAATLGAANGLPADAVLPAGKTLRFPDDSWGSAPPDQINPGTACVEHTISTSSFQTLPGIGAGPIEIDEPDAVSADVVILGNANDWTVVADGEAGTPNRAGVKVLAGTAVTFENVEGLHTITVDGEKRGEDLEQAGTVRTIAFDAPGEYRITCDYHADMLAVVFVVEEAE